MAPGAIMYLSLLVTATYWCGVYGGRSVPVETEYIAEDIFHTINPNIRWDVTNFLVDLSGPYAVCAVSQLRRRGQVSVEHLTPGGANVTGLVDYTQGGATDAKTQEVYAKKIFTGWSRDSPFRDIIIRAKLFGCSIQPGCHGYSVVACLFDTGLLRNLIPIHHTHGWGFAKQPHIEDKEEPKRGVRTGRIQAFTKDQYRLVESISHHRWDRSHFLENLSGLETSCHMINQADWPFERAKQEGRTRHMRIEGVFGSVENTGDIWSALIHILLGWSIHYEQMVITDLGCSLIPDCPVDERKYVVLACLYSIG